VLSIRAGSTVLQFTGSGAGQIEGGVEFAVGQESGIAGNLGAEESEPETAVELRSKRLGWAVTREVCSSDRQEVVGNPGIRRVLAQLSCRFRLLIWEIRAVTFLTATALFLPLSAAAVGVFNPDTWQQHSQAYSIEKAHLERDHQEFFQLDGLDPE
jgi:hypothetical protein